jgi:hypothetical protein
VGCAICSHKKRREIERACDGADVLEVAVDFGVSKNSLARHLKDHTRLSIPVPPKKKARARAEEAPPAPPVTVPSGGQTLAKTEIAALFRSVRELVKQAEKDEAVSYSEKASLMRAAIQALKLLGQLTGEIGQNEASLVASPQWKRFTAVLLDVLRPHPEALKAVVAKLEHMEAA